MNAIAENLRTNFQTFVEIDEALPFINGLIVYINDVFRVPELGHVFAKQMDERKRRHQEIWGLEETAVSELLSVGAVFKKIIEGKEINIRRFKRIHTEKWSRSSTLFSEIEGYSRGHANKDVWRSNDMQECLMDIARGLHSRGHKEILRQFAITPDTRGKLIFSSNLIARGELDALIRRERMTKPWGSFEKLYQVKQAYEASSRNETIRTTLKGKPVAEYGITAADATEIISLQEKLEELLQKQTDLSKEYQDERKYRPMIKNLRHAAKTVHATLMPIALEVERYTSAQYWIVRDAGGRYYFDGHRIEFPNPGAEYVKIFAAVFSLIPQGGKVTYSDMKKKYKAASRRAVQHALTGKDARFFHYVTSVEQLPGPGIVPLFKTLRNGKALLFNNKR